MILFEIWPSILCFSAPKIRNEGNTILLPEGEDARLICSVKGKETSGNKAIVFWEKNNATIQPGSHNRMRIRPYRYLKIKRVTKEDSGFYTCVAENSCGRNAITWRLVIGSKLLWRSIPAKIQCCILLFAFYPTFVVWHPSLHFRHSTFLVQHSSFCLVHSPFRTQCSSSSSAGCMYFQVFVFNDEHLPIKVLLSFNIRLYVFHLQVCIVYSTF